MEKEFVPYELALELKQLGFDERCLGGYSTSTKKLEFYSRPLITGDSFTVDAPTFTQTFRWFREKYGLLCYIRKVGKSYWYNIDAEDGSTLDDQFEGRFDTYEEAELACLQKLIEIVKQK
jgi:hypothetical protein